MSHQTPTLADRMREKAKTVEPGIAAELLAHADKLDKLGLGETPIPVLVGTWAKARRYWCDLTGESLV